MASSWDSKTFSRRPRVAPDLFLYPWFQIEQEKKCTEKLLVCCVRNRSHTKICELRLRSTYFGRQSLDQLLSGADIETNRKKEVDQWRKKNSYRDNVTAYYTAWLRTYDSNVIILSQEINLFKDSLFSMTHIIWLIGWKLQKNQILLKIFEQPVLIKNGNDRFNYTGEFIHLLSRESTTFALEKFNYFGC